MSTPSAAGSLTGTEEPTLTPIVGLKSPTATATIVPDSADDHGDRHEDATQVSVWELVVGNISHDSDVDYFGIDAEKGELYEVLVSAKQLHRVRLRVFDGQGELITETTQRTALQPKSDGKYFIEVADYYAEYVVENVGNQRFDYTLTVKHSSIFDDHGYDFETATEMEVSGKEIGTFAWSTDVDFFRFHAIAGRSYHLRISRGNVRPNMQLLNSSSEVLAGSDHHIDWPAHEDGIYYIKAIEEDGESGYYALEIDYSDYQDDHSDVPERATAVTLGEKFSGVTGGYNDVDYFRFSPEAGKSYRVLVNGAASVKIFDNNQNQVASVGVYKRNWVFLDAASDSDFYVTAEGAIDEYPVGYEISIEPYDRTDDHGNTIQNASPISIGEWFSGEIEFEPDVDVFTFTAERDTTYQLAIGDDGLVWNYLPFLLDAEGSKLAPQILFADDLDSFVWTASESGQYFIVVTPPYRYVSEYRTGYYSLSVNEFIEDHADDPEDATVIALNETVQGELHNRIDVDNFKFVAEPGMIYQIDVVAGSLPSFNVHYFPSSNPSQEHSKHEERMPVVWRASKPDIYHFNVSSSWHHGTYEVTLTQTNDDHGDDSSSPTEVVIGETMHGEVEDKDDVDFFIFEAVEGQAYQLTFDYEEVSKAQISLISSTNEETLFTAYEWSSLEVVWHSDVSEMVLIELFGVEYWHDGPYTFRVDPIEGRHRDDHGNTLKTATAIEIGSEVRGMISEQTDRDLFRFSAEKGEVYTIRINDDRSSNFIVQIVDLAGRQIATRPNVLSERYCDPSSRAYENQIVWESPESGDFFIEIAFNGDSYEEAGDYSFVVDIEGEVDDHGNAMIDATELTPGESVSGVIGWGRDVDVFRFVGERDRAYTIKVELATGERSEFDVIDGFNQKLPLAPGTKLYSIPIDDNTFWPCKWVEPFVGDYQDTLTFESRYLVEYFVTVMEPEADGPTPYTISVTETKSLGDVGETPALAMEIQAGQTVKSAFEYWNDADLFFLNAEDGQGYQIDFTLIEGSYASAAILSKNAYGLHLVSDYYGRDSHWDVNASEESGYSANFSGVFVAQSEDVYLMLFGSGRGDGSSMYEFTLRVVPDIDNDNESVLEIPVDEIHYDLIDHVEDVDNFTFVVGEGKVYEVEIEIADTASHEIRIRDDMYEVHRSEGSWRESGSITTSYRTAKSGKHYIEISNWNRTDYSIKFTPVLPRVGE